jgi:hypothetical protein
VLLWWVVFPADQYLGVLPVSGVHVAAAVGSCGGGGGVIVLTAAACVARRHERSLNSGMGGVVLSLQLSLQPLGHDPLGTALPSAQAGYVMLCACRYVAVHLITSVAPAYWLHVHRAGKVSSWLLTNQVANQVAGTEAVSASAALYWHVTGVSVR